MDMFDGRHTPCQRHTLAHLADMTVRQQVVDRHLAGARIGDERVALGIGETGKLGLEMEALRAQRRHLPRSNASRPFTISIGTMPWPFGGHSHRS